jgi:hypothetical protein
MSNVVRSHTSIVVPVKICIELSCYLKFPDILKNDFRENTAIFEPPINEDYYSFVKRMKNHKEIHEYVDESSTPIWYITHKTNINKICSLNGYFCDEINYLDCIIFKGKRGSISDCYKYSNRDLEKIIIRTSNYSSEKRSKNIESKKNSIHENNSNNNRILSTKEKELDNTEIILVD